MTGYRRFRSPGTTWYFPVNLGVRQGDRLSIERIAVLRAAFAAIEAGHPFRSDAIAVLRDHLHCVWILPVGDSNFSKHRDLIKGYFSRHIERGELGLCQRHFWKHFDRGDTSYHRHIDYIHRNLVKHGRVPCVKDWPHFSFRDCVRRGIYPPYWGSDADWSNVMAGG